MPYRIEIRCPPADALDRLIQFEALDVEQTDAGLAAIIPDVVNPDDLAAALAVTNMEVGPAVARDDDSVWLIGPRTVGVGSLVIAPPDKDAPAGALRLLDSSAFGTGHHPTTALCIEILEEVVTNDHPGTLLDVGTGSGVLALAALKFGVPKAVAVDIDANALAVAGENARLNNLADRVEFIHGGPEAVGGAWPLIVANVLTAPLIEMAPALVQRLGSGGRLILSGIPSSLEFEVRRAYERLGLHHRRSEMRAGWMALVLQASW